MLPGDRMLRSRLLVTIPFLASFAVLVSALGVPETPDTVQAEPTQNPQSPIIRRTTRAVKVNVLVIQKDGQLVPGLMRDDFQVFDNGQQQQIAFFSRRDNTGTTIAGARPLFLGKYTNDFRNWDAIEKDATIILFDTIHTAYLSQAYSLEKIRVFLRQLERGDRVGIYVLTDKGLKVVCDLDEPASAILDALRRYDAAHSGAHGRSAAAAEDSTGLETLDGFLRGNDNHQPTKKCNPKRFKSSIAAFQDIARRTSGLGGRKTVIWVTDSVSFPLGSRNAFDYAQGKFCGMNYSEDLIFEDSAYLRPPGNSGRSRGLQPNDSRPTISKGDPGASAMMDRGLSDNDEMDLLLRLLRHNDIAIYPVSAEGLQTVRLFGPNGMDTTAPVIPQPGANTEAVVGAVDAVGNIEQHQQMLELARFTGGRAYYDRNDLETGIRRALDDARSGYELVYYPEHDDWNGDWRRIEVKVNRRDATVLARGGYYAFPEARLLPPKASEQLLDEIAASPLQDTGVPITVRLKPRDAAASTLEARVYLDAQTLFRNELADSWRSDFELVFFQLDGQNQILGRATQNVSLVFPRAKYDEALKRGINTLERLQLKPGAAQLCVVIHDKKSDATGSVRIPL